MAGLCLASASTLSGWLIWLAIQWSPSPDTAVAERQVPVLMGMISEIHFRHAPEDGKQQGLTSSCPGACRSSHWKDLLTVSQICRWYHASGHDSHLSFGMLPLSHGVYFKTCFETLMQRTTKYFESNLRFNSFRGL